MEDDRRVREERDQQADPGAPADRDGAARDEQAERAERRTGLALVVVLALLTGLWGAFLVPLRVGGVAVPVAVLVAGVANAVLGVAGGRLAGRSGAAAPGLVWFGVVVVLQSRRPEGDLVLPNTTTGLLFLVVGTLVAAVTVGLAPPRPRGAPPSPHPAPARTTSGVRPGT